jgi:hypothetical protein
MKIICYLLILCFFSLYISNAQVPEITCMKNAINGYINYCQGEDIVLSLSTETISAIQWQKQVDNQWVDLSVLDYPSVFSKSLEIINSKIDDSGIYRIKLSQIDEVKQIIVYSNEISIIVKPIAKILIHPEGQVICRNSQAILSVKVSGTNPIYQWQKDNEDISTIENPTADKAVFVINNSDFDNNGSYRCKVKIEDCVSPEDSQGDNILFTNSALVYVMTETRVINQSDTIYKQIEDSSAILEVNIQSSGNSVIEYQWYRGSTALNDNAKYSGTKTTDLAIKDISMLDFGADYYLIIKDICGKISRSDFIILNEEPLYFAEQPSNISLCENQQAFFVVNSRTALVGAVIKYEWYFIDMNSKTTKLSDTNHILSIESRISNEGYYYCVASVIGTNISIKSSMAKLNCYTKPIIIKDLPLSVSVPFKTRVNVEVIVQSEIPVYYQWYEGNSLDEPFRLCNFHTSRFGFTNANSFADTSYICYVVVSNECDTVTSNVFCILFDNDNQTPENGDLSVNELLLESVSHLRPNPASESTILSVNFGTARYSEINIIDALGDKVMKIFSGITVGKTDIPIYTNELTNGIYLVTISSNGKTITRQLVVNK